MSHWAKVEGQAHPQGVSWVEEDQSFNFSIYSKHAETVTLMLYKDSDYVNPVFTYEMDTVKNKSWRIWHCRVKKDDVKEAKYYAYRISGPWAVHRYEWHTFDPQKILLDPFTKAVFFPPTFNRKAAMQAGANDGQAPLGMIYADTKPFEWENDSVHVHEWDTIIYEMHVKGFTFSLTSGVSAEKKGTFLGVIDKIPYLKELGVTVLELLPVFQFDPQENNYWGYMPLNFFSPHRDYNSSKTHEDTHNEFRYMVKELHKANIEVVLDVVYNHTCEEDHNGPTYSFKGIDNCTYYFISGNPQRPYEDFAGTGNALHSSNVQVRKMIQESLAFWVKEMHVDGFRFDLASIFNRNADGSINLKDPPFFGDIAIDPFSHQTRLIAEPWDAAGGYHLGTEFPGKNWYQWNGKYRDDIRRFVRGDEGLVPVVMKRIYGSDDLFPDDRMNAYHAYQSVNFITSHDGFTLYDLVSYNHKHNLANGQNNIDGTNDNFSWNCGWEGDDDLPPEILKLRKQQAKNLTCILFLSNGTPMFSAGDEFLRTQKGNNNAYNQDNDISWIDWNLKDYHADFFRFFKMMIAFRKAHRSIGRSRFWREDITWYGTQGDTDMSYHSKHLAFYLSGSSQQDDDLYVMINSEHLPKEFKIEKGNFNEWKRVIDTSLSSPEDFRELGDEVNIDSQVYTVASRSVVVLIRKR